MWNPVKQLVILKVKFEGFSHNFMLHAMTKSLISTF